MILPYEVIEQVKGPIPKNQQKGLFSLFKQRGNPGASSLIHLPTKLSD
jgi:hypothetical protein